MAGGHTKHHDYHLVNPSPWPVIGSISLTVSEAARAVERQRLKQFAGACAGLGAVFVILLAIEFVSVGSMA